MATAATAPIVMPAPAFAQYQATVPSGTVIQVRYKDGDKIMVTPEETAPVDLIVAKDIKAPLGAILVPAGSTIKGQLQPAEGGSQYVASQIILPNGKQLPLDATSQVVTRKEEVRKGPRARSILVGTAVGAGAATALSTIFGGGLRGVKAWRVLAGAGAGAIGGTLLGRRKVELVSIQPSQDLALTLRSNLLVSDP
jgi:hypothetical protein